MYKHERLVWFHFNKVQISQLVEIQPKREIFKIRNNFLKVFRVDLKTFLGLAMPNQYCQAVDVRLVFEWYLFLGAKNLHDP